MIGHNCKAFDIKWFNTAFLRYNLPPPSPYKVIDTKVEAKKYLFLPSYALNNIADYFGLGRKVEHEGFSMWQECVKGDKKAWRRMKRYNIQDVNLTEKIYLKLKPLIKVTGVYPNVLCQSCGSNQLQSRGITLIGKHRRFQCKKCFSWMQILINKKRDNVHN